MKHFYLYILYFFCSVSLFGQSSVIDSLENILSNSDRDTNTVNILNKLSDIHSRVNPEKALDYVNEAIELAEKLKFARGLGKAYSVSGWISLIQHDYEKAKELYLKSLAIYKETDDKFEVSVSYHSIGIIYYYQSDYNRALEYFIKSSEVDQETGNKTGTAKSFNNIALIYNKTGNPSKAIEYHLKSLEIKKELGNKKGMAASYNNIGIIYKNQGNYSKGLENYLMSLNIYEELNDKKGMSNAFNNIGIINKNQRNFSKALEYFFESLKLGEKLDNKGGMADTYNNIGLTYENLEKFKLAIEYQNKSLDIRKEINDKSGIAISYVNIGDLYSKLKDYTKALEYQRKALLIQEEIGHKMGIAYSLNSIGNLYLNQKDYGNAIKYYKSCLQVANEIGDKEILKKGYEGISKAYAGIQDFKHAYEFSQLYYEVSDSIYNLESSKLIAELQTKYETEKKEQKIVLLSKEKEVQKVKLDRQRYFIISVTVSTVFLIILIIILLNRYRIKQRANKILTERNAEIQSQKEEIQAQADQIENANKEITRNSKLKELFFARMSHEIRTPVNVIVGFTNLLFNSKLTNKQSSYIENIKNSCKNLLVVINDILDFSKIEAGKLKLENTRFSLTELLQNFYNIMSVRANEKKLKLELNISEPFPELVIGDPIRLHQILTNLVANAIKFTNKGEIIISVNVKSHEKDFVIINFSISDTGIGIPDDRIDNIFESYTQADIQTTRMYGGTGLGLSIVKQLVDLQNGEIEVESETGKGSTFNFYIPYTEVEEEKTKTGTESFNMNKIKEIRELKILLVDDNIINRILAIDTIHMFNDKISIEEAENGAQAIEKLENKNFDLVLMDLIMPEMDGYEATKTIREKLNFPSNEIPILGMTANAAEDEREKCLSVGMNEYIAKPFNPDDLFEKIYNLTKNT